MRSVTGGIGRAIEGGDLSDSSSRAFSWLDSRGGFLLLLAFIFAAHVALRWFTSPAVDLDESEQLVFTQAWQWGYGPQPPLYTWLQILVFQIFAPSVLGLSVLKNSLLFATYACTYASARTVTRSHMAGIVAALSLLFIPQIAWESQRDLTHSVLAATFAAATLFLFLKLHQGARRQWYVLLGLALGLGTLSNYSYLLLVTGLALGTLCVKEFRAIILTRWALLSLGIGLALIMPHVWWMKDHPAMVLATSYKLRILPGTSIFVSAGHALLNLTLTWLSHVISILLIFSALCWREFVPLQRAVLRQPHARLLLLVMTSALLCVFVIMVATRATIFKGRWLQPVYVCVPVLLVALTYERMTRAAFQRIVATAVFVIVLVMVLLPSRIRLAQKLGRIEQLDAPLAELGQQLRPMVDPVACIAVDNFYVGGNLRLLFPEKTIITPQFHGERAASDARLVIFDATFEAHSSAEIKSLASWAGFDSNTANLRYVEAPFRSNSKHRMKLGVVTLR